jgi:hypothetical protein
MPTFPYFAASVRNPGSTQASRFLISHRNINDARRNISRIKTNGVRAVLAANDLMTDRRTFLQAAPSEFLCCLQCRLIRDLIHSTLQQQ